MNLTLVRARNISTSHQLERGGFMFGKSPAEVRNFSREEAPHRWPPRDWELKKCLVSLQNCYHIVHDIMTYRFLVKKTAVEGIFEKCSSDAPFASRFVENVRLQPERYINIRCVEAHCSLQVLHGFSKSECEWKGLNWRCLIQRWYMKWYGCNCFQIVKLQRCGTEMR